MAANEFAVRATGGVRFVSGFAPDGSVVSGVHLLPGSGSWATLSDRDAKNAFLPVDVHATLDALAKLPISTWQYRTQDASVRHMGPTAQDFYETFSLGEGQHYINTVDADGVALAAIQGLYGVVQEQRDQLEAQSLRLAVLEARLDALKPNQKSQPDFALWLGFWVLGFFCASLWIRWRFYTSGLSSLKP